MAYPEINTILRQTVNEVTTIHNSAPTIQTIISKDSPTVTTIVNGFWDAVWSVNGQTGDVRIEFTFDPFKPNTVYLQNQAIVHNDNIYIARESFTSGSTFNEADWNIIGDMANADMVTYNNTETGISATTVQDALDYVIGQVPTDFFKLSTTTISGEGNAITLANTAEVPFKNVVLKGDTFQQTYEGNNLFNYTSVVNLANGQTILESSTYRGYYIPTIPGTTYVLSRANTTGNNRFRVSFTIDEPAQGVTFYDVNGSQGYALVADDLTEVTFTVPANMNYVFVYLSNAGEAITESLKIQLELGSTATSYEPYVGGIPAPNPDYPQDINVVTGEQTVNVTGKNLFDNNSAPIATSSDTSASATSDGVRISYSGGTTTAARYATYLIGDISGYVGKNIVAQALMTPSGDNTPRLSIGVCKSDGSNRSTKTMIGQSGSGYYTITAEDVAERPYAYIYVYANNVDTGGAITSGDYCDYTNLQVEISDGTTPTSYEPYQSADYTLSLDSLELCKLGDYQDYIWTDGEKWYKHAEVGKTILDGSESWIITTNNRAFFIVEADVMPFAQDTMPSVASDYYRAETYRNVAGNGSCDYGIATHTSSGRISIRNKDISTASNFQSWLSTHNTTVYYALATATDTQITDATLVAQLEDLRSAYSYKEQTNISVRAIDPNLPFILSVDAFLNTTWEGFQSGVGKLAENVQQDTLKKWDVRDNISDGDDHLVTGGGVYDALRGIDNNSAAAHNSIVRGKDLTNIYTLDELSAKVQAGDFSDIYVGDYITKKVTVGSGTERELDFVIAHIDYFMHVGDTETTRHHLVMVPDTAFYEYMQMNDTNTTTGGYYGSKGHGICNAVYSAGTGGALTSVVADYTTFQATTLGAAEGTFVFTHTSSGWQYDGTVVSTGNLSAYGITYSGTPVDGDVITVSYVPGYLEPYRQAIYTAFGDTHILAHRTQYSTSTSTNAWHTNRCELMNESMVYGQIVRANNFFGELTENSQLAWFSARPDKRIAMRGKGSTSRTYAWLSSISSGSAFCIVASVGLANLTYASSSYAVRPYFLFA